METKTEKTEKTGGWRGSREVWLDAAREAFLSSGLDAVKIQPLATGLNLSRTSFYWFFPDRAALLDALLADWEETNTGSLERATQAYAETIAEAVLNLISVFLDGGPFETRLDLAVRGWAHQSEEVAARVRAADATRLNAIRGMFTRFGYAEGEADVRARTVYLTQIGYISMQVREAMEDRLARVPDYVMTFTGQAPTERDIARFRARHEAR
ncbi:putative transcriptional regulator TetR family protein [Roseobacter sp. AzwK-3b]|uniref:TetR/AcrR family transcriptional regulator n=1 Tax=Roseobacter sp. AzwK-3b TaxID=351016 RepID=UPI0001568C0E|nr:TetR/AcrR family transcriptional regulator [Roseobacter sp. AzwK-3b]EDM71527.1 putative transcriptional regulator TetR family protein [Roseobacter sp. AzwK-3b]